MANKLSLSNSSSTGTAGVAVYFDPGVSTLTMQTWTPSGSTAAGTVQLQGSLNGRDWTTVGTSTHAGASTLFSSTSANVYSAVRAVLATHTAGDPLNATVAGK